MNDGYMGDKPSMARFTVTPSEPVHVCHWPGCGKPVEPKFWGCPPHWFALSGAIRRRIWLTYRKGQETDKNPSPEYLAAAQDARKYALAKIEQARGKAT